MSIWHISIKNLLFKRTLSILTVLAVTVATALLVFIMLVNEGMEKGVEKGYGPYELVIGAKGSPTQLALNTFYQMGAPTGNIPFHVYEELQESELVEAAYPVTRGDSYLGFPIVGTMPGYLSTRYPNAVLVSGGLFQQAGEVTIGSYVAKELSLQVGDTFFGSHGVAEGASEAHTELKFTVVGVLPKLGTPDDKAIFTTYDTAWLFHEHEEAEEGQTESAEQHEEEGDITAIVVKPKGLLESQAIKTQWNQLDGVQAIYSGKAISDVLSIIDSASKVIKMIALACVLLATISILLALVAMTAERKKDIGLLRLIGKSRGFIVRGLLVESNLLAVIGVTLGILVGHFACYLLKEILFNYASIELQPLMFVQGEVFLFGGGLLLASMAAALPAVQAYRVEPMKLFQS